MVAGTSVADLSHASALDRPAFLRGKEAAGESSGSTYRGYQGLIIDNEDLDVPTFLRKKAD